MDDLVGRKPWVWTVLLGQGLSTPQLQPRHRNLGLPCLLDSLLHAKFRANDVQHVVMGWLAFPLIPFSELGWERRHAKRACYLRQNRLDAFNKPTVDRPAKVPSTSTLSLVYLGINLRLITAIAQAVGVTILVLAMTSLKLTNSEAPSGPCSKAGPS